MLGTRLKCIAAIFAFSCLSVVACSGQKMKVKIIQRQNSETEYHYVVPGQINSTSNTNLNCDTGLTNVNCSGRTITNGTVTAPRQISYNVTGATFSLLLPDGRIAVVNCDSKLGFTTPRRSCRTPLVDDIQVEFKGKNAKLLWPAGIDGRTFDSETYKILAVLNK
jgi:hypothetical protein